MEENMHVAFDEALCASNPSAAADKIASLEGDIALVRKSLKSVLASLVAATSLIVRAEDMKVRPSLAAASDKMFLQMLKDYDAVTFAARALLQHK